MDLDDARKRMKRWLRGVLADPPGETVLTRLTLVARGGGGGPDSYLMSDEIEAKTADPDELAAMFFGEAELDADGVGGKCEYELHAFFGTKTARRKHRFAIVVRETNPYEIDSYGKGIDGQLLRHNEIFMRHAVGTSDKIMTNMQKIIERQQARIEELELKHLQSIETTEKLLTLQHEREMEVIKVESNEKRMDEMVDSAKLLLPIVVDKFKPGAGKLLSSGSTNGDSKSGVEINEGEKAALIAFVESLTEEQFRSITSELNPGQNIVFMEIMKKVQESRGVKEEKKPRRLRDRKNHA